jgi:hypothetical protein
VIRAGQPDLRRQTGVAPVALTGRNHHSVAIGSITETASAAPGQTSLTPNIDLGDDNHDHLIDPDEVIRIAMARRQTQRPS